MANSMAHHLSELECTDIWWKALGDLKHGLMVPLRTAAFAFKYYITLHNIYYEVETTERKDVIIIA